VDFVAVEDVQGTGLVDEGTEGQGGAGLVATDLEFLLDLRGDAEGL
jgi:hypothetical protein